MPHLFSELYFEYHTQLLSSFGCPKSGGNSGEKCRCWAIPQCYFQSRTTVRKPSHPSWASLSLSLSLSARIEQYVFLTPQFHGYYCDEWGGAESRGNGARPVEWMIMNDTCATHRSRVPRRSSGRNKRRSDNSGRRERTRPGILVCVLCAAVDREGLPLFICVCLFD